MKKNVVVTIADRDGAPQPAYLLETLYASDLHFEPEVRESRLLSDGRVEIRIATSPFMLHARLNIPLYGNIWVMAHNADQGFTDTQIDFTREAVKTYLWEANKHAEGLRLPASAAAHLDAAQEYDRLADEGVDTHYCRLMALSHAIFAAEAACYERARQIVAMRPRTDLLLGCNAFKYPGPSRFEDYFTEVFDFATIPFYYRELVPEEGEFDYRRRDELVEWCEANAITPKGHPLWFGHEETNPQWMFGKSFGELSEFAHEAIAKTVTRYRGRVKVWDAINEPHDWANCFGFSQPELLQLADICTRTVRASDPEATSIINACLPFGEYVAGRFVCYGPVFDEPVSPMTFFRRSIEARIDFDVIGLQMYFPARDLVAISRLIDQYAGLGKPVHITEMGVPGGIARGESDNVEAADDRSQIGLTKGVWHAPWNEHVQADWLEQFYTIAASKQSVTALTWWDFMDPGFMKTSPFLFEDQVPRELYFRLKALRPKLLGQP